MTTQAETIEEAEREHRPNHIANSQQRKPRRPHSALHIRRAAESLDHRFCLHLLPVDRPGILVSLLVLDGDGCRRRTDGPLLASMDWPDLRHRLDLDAETIAARHDHYRC